jgi:dihydroneopterin aldolase
MPLPLRTAVIRLEGMLFRSHHGVLPEERKLGGPFRVDLALTVVAPVHYRDRLAETLDYRLAHTRVESLMTRRRFHTLEALADTMADSLVRLPKVVSARVTVTKLAPPLGPGTVSAVEIERHR